MVGSGAGRRHDVRRAVRVEQEVVREWRPEGPQRTPDAVVIVVNTERCAAPHRTPVLAVIRAILPHDFLDTVVAPLHVRDVLERRREGCGRPREIVRHEAREEIVGRGLRSKAFHQREEQCLGRIRTPVGKTWHALLTCQ